MGENYFSIPKLQWWNFSWETAGMCCPLDPLFSPQVHPLVGYSDVKHTPVGYHLFIFSHSIWVIFVKFSYPVTLFGPFLWKFDIPVGVKIHPMDTIFWQIFLSQGYVFLPKSLAKGIFLTKTPKNGHFIGTRLWFFFGKFLLTREYWAKLA